MKNTILFKYLGPNDEIVSRQITKAATSTSIKKIREQFKKDIQQFNDKEIVFIHHNQIVEDDQTLGQLSQQGDVIILILPKIISINIIYGKDNPKRIDIDITLPIEETIIKFLKNQKIRKKGNIHSNYLLAYEKTLYPELTEKELKKKKQKQKKKKNTTKYQVCCATLPLYTHKWWYSNFYLIKRLSLEDIFIKNEEERQFLIEQAQFASSLGLCAYKVEDWAELISFQIFFHMKESTLIKEKIEEFTPPFIDCSPKLIQTKFKEIQSFSLIEAENKYIEESIKRGCQCSYVETVKMKWMRFWSKYKVYVSSMNIMIFSGNGKNFQYMKEIDSIVNVKLQGANIYSNYTKNENKNEESITNQDDLPAKNEANDIIKNENNNSNNDIIINSDDNLINDNINLSINSDNNNSSSNIINNSNTTINSESSLFFSNNSENDLVITIYFSDNTNWELCCDSLPAASRLKIVLDNMIALYHKNESNYLEKNSPLCDSNINISNGEEEEISDQLNNIPGEKLGIFNPSESFDISSQSLFNLPSDSKTQYTQYPHYSVIITPEEIRDQVVFNGYDGYNHENEFNFLKNSIQPIKILKNDKEIVEDKIPINNNDPLLANFFALGPNERANRNFLIIIIFAILALFFIFKYYARK